MLDYLLKGKYCAFYIIKQDMVRDNWRYRNIYKMIPALLESDTYASAREEARTKRDKNVMLVSVEEITNKDKKKILKVFK